MSPQKPQAKNKFVYIDYILCFNPFFKIKVYTAQLHPDYLLFFSEIEKIINHPPKKQFSQNISKRGKLPLFTHSCAVFSKKKKKIATMAKK